MSRNSPIGQPGAGRPGGGLGRRQYHGAPHGQPARSLAAAGQREQRSVRAAAGHGQHRRRATISRRLRSRAARATRRKPAQQPQPLPPSRLLPRAVSQRTARRSAAPQPHAGQQASAAGQPQRQHPRLRIGPRAASSIPAQATMPRPAVHAGPMQGYAAEPATISSSDPPPFGAPHRATARPTPNTTSMLPRTRRSRAAAAAALMIVAALVGAIGLGGGLAYTYKTLRRPERQPRAADQGHGSGPEQGQAATPGGREFAHTDKKLLNRLGDDAGARPRVAPPSRDARGARQRRSQRAAQGARSFRLRRRRAGRSAHVGAACRGRARRWWRCRA